jgi:hypothetical protein
MTFFLRAGVSLVAALLVMVVSAQDELPELIAGEPLTVMLDAENPAVTLRYESPGNESVRVSARDLATGEEPVDTVLRLIAPDRLERAYADHSPGDEPLSESDALLPAVMLHEAGTYTLWVSSYGEIGVGEVEVTLEVVDVFDVETQPAPDGISVLARLPEGRVFTYEFDAEPGTWTVTVRDTSGTLDPRLMLHDADGALIAHNDDHASRDLTLNVFDSRIVTEFTGGILTVTVSDFLGRAGTFELTITRQSNP